MLCFCFEIALTQSFGAAVILFAMLQPVYPKNAMRSVRNNNNIPVWKANMLVSEAVAELVSWLFEVAEECCPFTMQTKSVCLVVNYLFLFRSHKPNILPPAVFSLLQRLNQPIQERCTGSSFWNLHARLPIGSFVQAEMPRHPNTEKERGRDREREREKGKALIQENV